MALADFRIEGATTPHGLLPAEEKLAAAAARGEWCIVSDLDWTKEDDLKKLRQDEKYHVRPDVLRCVALAADPAAPLHEKGIQLIGAFIPGDLDLEDTELGRPLWLHNCYFDGSVVLRNARTRAVSLGGSRIAGLEGDGAWITGALQLCNGFRANEEVRVVGVKIGSNFDCSSAMFQNAGKRCRAMVPRSRVPCS